MDFGEDASEGVAFLQHAAEIVSIRHCASIEVAWADALHRRLNYCCIIQQGSRSHIADDET